MLAEKPDQLHAHTCADIKNKFQGLLPEQISYSLSMDFMEKISYSKDGFNGPTAGNRDQGVQTVQKRKSSRLSFSHIAKTRTIVGKRRTWTYLLSKNNRVRTEFHETSWCAGLARSSFLLDLLGSAEHLLIFIQSGQSSDQNGRHLVQQDTHNSSFEFQLSDDTVSQQQLVTRCKAA